MLLRPYRPQDCAALHALFHHTIHTVNARDYSPEQLSAWSTGQVDLDAWDRSFRAHHTLVAAEGERIVGFADMDESGYLDRLFVAAECQGQGIATALCDALEGASSAPRFTTHASLTARPFFEKRGYRVVRAQEVERRGVRLRNFVMEKPNA